MAYFTTLTDDEAKQFAAIYASLAQLGAYGGAAVWHDGERHGDDALADLLLEVYACAYCAGANLPCDVDHTAHTHALLLTLAERHRVEVLKPRGWDDPPLLADELPGWLLRQKRYGAEG